MIELSDYDSTTSSFILLK